MLHFRLRLIALLEIVENEQIGVVARRSLLETAVRLAQQRIESLLQIGQRGRINLYLTFESAIDPCFGQRHGLRGRAFQNVAMGLGDGEAFGRDAELGLNAVGRRTARFCP